MATRAEKLEILQELANRGEQDLLPPDKKAIFDQLVANGAINLTQKEPERQRADFSQADAFGRPPEATQQPEIIPPQQDESLTGQIDRQIGMIGEPALALASGAVAEPIAGVAGILESINPFTEDRRGAAAETVEGVREALTFKPESAEGKIGLRNVASFGPVKKFIDVLEGSEKFLGDAGFALGSLTGSENLAAAGGAFGASIPTAILEALGLVSLKKLRLGKANLLDKSGRPGKELQKALDDVGVDFDSMTPEQVKELGSVGAVSGETAIPGVKRGAPKVDAEARRAETIARKSRFEELDIPFTEGDITGEFKQVSKEQRLLTQNAKEEVSAPLREAKAAQSAAFIDNVETVVNDLGGTAEGGEILKGALEGRLKLLKKEKNALYKEFAETSPETKNIPIITDTILEAVPPKNDVRRIRRLKPTEADAFSDLLVEFGIDKDAAKVDAFLKGGDDITPLDIGNIDDFRQGINLIERGDQTGTIKNITGPVKRALDNEADLVDQAARSAGVTDDSVLAPLKEARKKVVEIKQEFSPESITGKLIKIKKDGVTPVVEASKALDQILKKSAPIEFLERTLDTLNKSGPKGKTAIRSMQATIVLKALENALKNTTNTFRGVKQITPNQFVKAFNEFGDAKLNLLFKDNPKALADFRKLKGVAEDITPPAAAVPRGSAPIVLDLAQKLGQFPVVSQIKGMVELLAKVGDDPKTVKRAIEANPEFDKTRRIIVKELPELATVLGLGLASGEVEKNKAITGVQVDIPGREPQILTGGRLETGTLDNR
jgi:hypothetical protein